MQIVEAWLVVRIYLFLCKAGFLAAMGKLITLLFIFTIMFGCSNNRNDRDNNKVQKEDNQSNDKPGDTSSLNSSDKSYTWTKADQKKFTDECINEYGEDLASEKLKDFCSCILTQAQKYYPSFKRAIEEEESHDWEMFDNCKNHYPDEEQ